MDDVFRMVFAAYTDTEGCPYIRSRGALPDSLANRELLKQQAAEALGTALSGFRFTGSELRSANPQGLVGIVAW